MNYQVENYTIEEIGRQDKRSIGIAVVGYWSRDVITVYCHRVLRTDWDFSISYGSGGRDPNAEPDDCVAVRNFAEALVAASLIVEELRAAKQEIETFYQQYRDEIAKAADTERAEREAKLANDPAVGQATAEAMIGYMKNCGGIIVMYDRGEDKPKKMWSVKNHLDRTYFYVRGTKYSRAEATAGLAKMSQRTHWLQKEELTA